MGKRVEKILKILKSKYRIKPRKEDPFTTLIACILSQRTKDETTEEAAKRLFSVARKPEEILNLSTKKIEKLIYPVGFYRQKAKRIKELCKILLKRYEGKVPKTREELLMLPGVGLKTADVVLSYGYGEDVVAVDTHVAVISRRLGLTKSEDPEKIREDLHRLIPPKLRRSVNILFVEFGKDVCRTFKPKCSVCPLKNYCRYYKEIKGKESS
jgi:endonuclease-3